QMWRLFLNQPEPTDDDEAELLAAVSDGLSGADIENISLAARRRTVLDGKEPEFAQILLAATASHAGNPALVDARELTIADRRRLATKLKAANVKVTEISKAIGVSRQMVHRYLSEDNHAR